MSKPNEIVLRRIYDAPVKLVWEAWTELEHVEKWWGPRGFTLTTHSKDFRPGGKWIYTMHGPDGTDYPNVTTYHEIVKYEKLVYDHGGNAERQKLFTVTALFKEEKGKTTLTMTSTLPTAEEAVAMRQFIKQAGGDSTWDRLGEYLSKQSADKEQFFITRSFDADIETMYDMWSRPEHIAKWLPPTGATMRYLRAEPQVGATSFYSMTFTDGPTIYGLIKYLAFERPNRIVYTQQFCDENERVMRPPFFKNWPETMLTTVELVAEGPDRTRAAVRWEPHDFTDADINEFISQRNGMTMGWTGSFDKLDALLAIRKEAVA